jgi:hypothetical protein
MLLGSAVEANRGRGMLLGRAGQDRHVADSCTAAPERRQAQSEPWLLEKEREKESYARRDG